jgi:glycyl-tRNA synthetase
LTAERIGGAIDFEKSLSEIVSLCKRRGFIFQSSEIYGGLASCWDYGPLGVELKNNVKRLWWEYMVTMRNNVEGMDGSILMHPRTWVASGHVDSFSDPMVDCRSCKKRFRLDHLKDPASKNCPECGNKDCLTEPRDFNLMLKTKLGPVDDRGVDVYLRPETCQAIFLNFKVIQQCMRKRIPFGIAQIGKAFRNEIVTKSFIFRSREFEQMEMQFFVKPGEDQQWYEYWRAERHNYYLGLGINPDKIRLIDHGENLAHYAKAAEDLEYEFPFGWQEFEGIHNRGVFDLTQHSEFSNKNLTYRDDLTGETFLPNVIETSVGVDRTILMLLCDAYAKDVADGEERTVLRFNPRIAPIQVAVFPLMRKPPLKELAEKVEKSLRIDIKLRSDYDETGQIGKRYRRHDEIGTPFCLTIDFDSLDNNDATVRDRDSMQQVRVSLDRIGEYLKSKLEGAPE